MLMRTPFHVIAVFLARMVMPRSRSSGLESRAHSCTTSPRRKAPACFNRPSTSVVFPWSTCATIAMFLTSLRCMRTGGSSRTRLSGPVEIESELLGGVERGDAEDAGRRGVLGRTDVGERSPCHIGDDRVGVAQGDLADGGRRFVVDDRAGGRLRHDRAERNAVGAHDAELAGVAVEAQPRAAGVAGAAAAVAVADDVEAHLAGGVTQGEGVLL